MKIDFHVHSIESQDGTATLCHIAKAAKAAGLDAVCICDHNRQTLTQPVEMEGVWMLPGCEISAEYTHILAILPEEKLNFEALCPGDKLPAVKAAIDEIHRCRGLAVIAHPYAHGPVGFWNPEFLTERPDGMEVANARAWMKTPDANEKASECAQQLKLSQFGGSDAHLTDELGNAYTEVDCSGIEDVKTALSEGRCRGILVQNTKRIYKGYSQLERRNRTKRSGQKLIGLAFLTKCWLYDLLKK